MSPPPSASPLTHLKRAFGWNLGQVVPSAAEVAKLTAAGVTASDAQRYAVWRRSLLLVATAATLVAFVLAVLDTLESGFDELTWAGTGLDLAWLVAAGLLPAAGLLGAARWTRPGAGAAPLFAAWAATFLLPFVYALLPAGLLYHVGPITPPAVVPAALKAAAKPAPAKPAAKPTPASKKADPDDDDTEQRADDDEPDAPLDPAVLEKAVALEEMAVEFVLAGGGYLLLLPAVLSLIPGALNGCLRVKALLPAAQLPGWLLVCAAPAFLLFWLVVLVLLNHAARSPLLVFGVLLWAGSPILYSVFGRVFVRSQLTGPDAARISTVKRAVGLTGLAGIGLLLAFVLTTKVAGLKVVGFDRPACVSTKIEELSDADDEVSLEDVQTALAESKAFVYAFDLSSFRLVIDFLAKMLVVTAVFADLVLRATLIGWRNERSLRSAGREAEFDGSAGALDAALGGR